LLPGHKLAFCPKGNRKIEGKQEIPNGFCPHGFDLDTTPLSGYYPHRLLLLKPLARRREWKGNFECTPFLEGEGMGF
jgi:hypothetical protein